MAMSECVRRVSTLQSLTSELPRLLLYLPFDSITLFAFFAQPRTTVLLFGSTFYARGPKASSARMQPLQPFVPVGVQSDNAGLAGNINNMAWIERTYVLYRNSHFMPDFDI